MRGILNFAESSPPKSNYIDYYSCVNREKWLPEHYSAFQQSQDYNLFFYFFHRPKEKLHLGDFSQEETELFLNNLISLFQIKGCDSNEIKGNWGIFSLYMPFRNGLACYSHYLSLKARNVLKNTQKIKGFNEFFQDLEPGFLQTTNQRELLEKVQFFSFSLNFSLIFLYNVDEYRYKAFYQ